jgi:hypothetical protein
LTVAMSWAWALTSPAEAEIAATEIVSQGEFMGGDRRSVVVEVLTDSVHVIVDCRSGGVDSTLED